MIQTDTPKIFTSGVSTEVFLSTKRSPTLGTFCLNVRKHFFVAQVMEHWHSVWDQWPSGLNYTASCCRDPDLAKQGRRHDGDLACVYWKTAVWSKQREAKSSPH